MYRVVLYFIAVSSFRISRVSRCIPKRTTRRDDAPVKSSRTRDEDTKGLNATRQEVPRGACNPNFPAHLADSCLNREIASASFKITGPGVARASNVLHPRTGHWTNFLQPRSTRLHFFNPFIEDSRLLSNSAGRSRLITAAFSIFVFSRYWKTVIRWTRIFLEIYGLQNAIDEI